MNNKKLMIVNIIIGLLFITVVVLGLKHWGTSKKSVSAKEEKNEPEKIKQGNSLSIENSLLLSSLLSEKSNDDLEKIIALELAEIELEVDENTLEELPEVTDDTAKTEALAGAERIAAEEKNKLKRKQEREEEENDSNNED